MTGKEIKDRDTKLVRYLFKCYPDLANEDSDDHRDFIDDLTDLMLARAVMANEKLRDVQ